MDPFNRFPESHSQFKCVSCLSSGGIDPVSWLLERSKLCQLTELSQLGWDGPFQMTTPEFQIFQVGKQPQLGQDKTREFKLIQCNAYDPWKSASHHNVQKSSTGAPNLPCPEPKRTEGRKGIPDSQQHFLVTLQIRGSILDRSIQGIGRGRFRIGG